MKRPVLIVSGLLVSLIGVWVHPAVLSVRDATPVMRGQILYVTVT